MASPLAVRIASQLAAAAGTAGVVSMPVPEAGSWAEVGPFGLFGGPGLRQFRRSLEIVPRPQQPLDLLAMCAGEIVRVPAGYLVGPQRTRAGASAVTRNPGLLLTVSPIGPVLATLGLTLGKGTGAAGVLELPEPTWIVYEHAGSLTLDPALEQVAVWDIFDGIPVDFPDEIDPTDSDPTAADPPPADPSAIVSPYADLPADVRDRFDLALAAIADRLAQDPLALEIVVEGHTDTTGRESDNLRLSVRRAKMIRRRLVQLILERAPDLEWDDWMAILQVLGLGEGDVWFVRDTDEPRRAANRRVEVKARAPIKVQAGQRLGSVTDLATITIVDRAGRLLDPLDLVRRYDVHQEFPRHPLGIFRDPMAPAIASGWVHVLSPQPDDDGAVEEDEPFFRFPAVELPGDNPLAEVLEGPEPVEPGDIIWIAEQAPGTPPIQTEITIDRPISLVSGGTPMTGRPPAEGAPPLTPMIRVVGPMAADLGVRLLGLNLEDGRTPAEGGAAVRVLGAHNVHIAGCSFVGNEVSLVPGEGGAGLETVESGAGGAVYLENCRQVLIEDCWFLSNSAPNGGALAADSCDGVVVLGRPLEAPAETAYQALLADPPATVPSNPSHNPLAGENYAARFHENAAQDAGGALLFRNTRFRVENCAFTNNTAQTSGGALAAFADEPGRVNAARREVATQQPLLDTTDHTITHCLASLNRAAAGGAFTLGGPHVDPRDQASGALVVDVGTLAEIAGAALLGGPTGVVAVASSVTGPSAAGGLFAVLGNLVDENRAMLLGPEQTSGLGGGLCLASGVVTLSGNRIARNIARGYGGGVACIGNACVDLRSNRIHANQAFNAGTTGPPGDIGVPGGGAIYAHGYGSQGTSQANLSPGSLPRTDRTVVRLFGNTLQENSAFRDGGAILATCGALVVSGGAASERQQDVEPNAYESNEASWNGGAISIRNADLEIWGGDSFVNNRASRDGGALFAGGTTIYLEPTAAKIAADFARRTSSDLPSARGTRVIVSGSSAEPVTFTGNRAANLDTSQGGAIFLAQQPATPIGAGPTLTANFSVGLLRSVSIQHAQFAGNWSDGGFEGLPGSTIATLGLDHRWRDEYPGADALSALNEILGNDSLGPYTLTPLDIEVNQGLGLLLLNSEAPDIPLSVGAALVRDSAGRPAGEGWAPEMRRSNVDRPMEP